jgi:hypothetical protein
MSAYLRENPIHEISKILAEAILRIEAAAPLKEKNKEGEPQIALDSEGKESVTVTRLK